MQEFEIFIRPVGPGDSIGLSKVQVDTWRDAYAGMLSESALIDLDEMRSAMRWTRLIGTIEVPERLLVAEHEGEIIGFCHGGAGRRTVTKIGRYDHSVAEVYALYIDPSFQGMGIGRELLGRFAQSALTDGFQSLSVQTLSENRHARRFYEALGAAEGVALPSVVTGTPVDQIPYFWPDIGAMLAELEAAQL